MGCTRVVSVLGSALSQKIRHGLQPMSRISAGGHSESNLAIPLLLAEFDY